SIFVNSNGVFNQNVIPTRWPAGSGGWVIIQVCIDPDSSADEKGDDALAGLLHEPKPTLDEGIRHVRIALGSSWESYRSISFLGWNPCGSPIQPDGIHLYIHPKAGNESNVGYTDTFGTFRGTNFQPWGGSFNRCIRYNASTTKVEYSFECVEQYAI